MLLLLAACLSSGQEPKFRTTAPLVIAPATVSDREGRKIDGLSELDFLVYDNGRLQTARLDTFQTVSTPVSLVVAVQSNRTAAAVIAKLKKTGSMIQPLVTGEDGEAAVIAFDDEIRVLQDFTSDPWKITETFEKLQARSGTTARMTDAVMEAIRLLGSRPWSRRILLVIGESKDRGSHSSPMNAVALAQQKDISVYAATFSAYLTPFTTKAGELPPPTGGLDLIGTFRELGRVAKRNTAEALAEGTGGTRVSFATLRSLEQAISRMGEEVHSQYILSFAPEREGSPGFHQIEVRVRNRPELTVRTRPGYWKD
jgi:VWFA-related protein